VVPTRGGDLAGVARVVLPDDIGEIGGRGVVDRVRPRPG